MTAHKHAKLIKAKADNMELVVFTKSTVTNKWEVTSFEDLVKNEDFDFFLCLPQHKEACLHWLNGGDVLVKGFHDGVSERIVDSSAFSGWHENTIFMINEAVIRTKPRKEKLWLAVKTDKHEHLGECRKVRICSHAFVNKQDAEDYLDMSDSQLIEIEVEV